MWLFARSTEATNEIQHTSTSDTLHQLVPNNSSSRATCNVMTRVLVTAVGKDICLVRLSRYSTINILVLPKASQDSSMATYSVKGEAYTAARTP